jgi:hypothetical protein
MFSWLLQGFAKAFTWLAAPTSWPGYDTFTAWDIKQYDNDKFQLDGRKVDLDQTSRGSFGQWGIAACVEPSCSD